MGHRRILDNDQRIARTELIDHLYSSGCTARSIAVYLAVSHGTVVNALNFMNTPRRPRGRPKIKGKVDVSPVELMGRDYVPSYMTQAELASFKGRVASFEDIMAQPKGSVTRSDPPSPPPPQVEPFIRQKKYPDELPETVPQIALDFDPPITATASPTPSTATPAALVGTMTESTVSDLVAARLAGTELAELASEDPELTLFPNAGSENSALTALTPHNPDKPDEDDELIAY